MRAYHQFYPNRSISHLLVAFAILILPIVGLLFLSITTHIPLQTAFLDLLISTWRLAVAFVIATIISWILVVVLVRGKTEGITLAVFDVLQSLPTFTILPMAVHYLGKSETTIIFFLTITVIWPIIFSIVSSLKQVDGSWHEAVTIYKVKGFNYIAYYLLPVTMPGLVTGAIIGLGDGWEALIATELLLGTQTGLGPFFNKFGTNFSMTILGVLIFLSFIFAINKFVWLPLLEKSHRLTEQ